VVAERTRERGLTKRRINKSTVVTASEIISLDILPDVCLQAWTVLFHSTRTRALRNRTLRSRLARKHERALVQTEEDQRIFGQFSENFRDGEGRKKIQPEWRALRAEAVHVRYLRAIDRNASGKEVNYFFAEHSVYASPVKPWPYHFVAVNQARSSPADPVRGSHRSGQIRRREWLVAENRRDRERLSSTGTSSGRMEGSCAGAARNRR